MTILEQKIIILREQGKSYREIQSELGCSKGTICYHLGVGQKHKSSVRQQKKLKRHPFVKKFESFRYTNRKNIPTKPKNLFTNKSLLKYKVRNFFLNRKTNIVSKQTFTVDDVIKKFGENPICYLTGEPIDINKPRTYQFDHIIPSSRGGDNSIDNLGICTKRANLAKSNMTPDELEYFCKRVLEHNGYIVTKCEK